MRALSSGESLATEAQSRARAFRLPETVDVGEAAERLREEIEGLVLAEALLRLLLEELRKVSELAVLEDQEREVVGEEGLVHLDDVRVVELLRQADLLLERVDLVFVRVEHDLHRELLDGVLLAHEEHLSEPALAEVLNVEVPVERLLPLDPLLLEPLQALFRIGCRFF